MAFTGERETGGIRGISTLSGLEPISKQTYGALIVRRGQYFTLQDSLHRLIANFIMLPLVKRLLATEERVQPDPVGSLKVKEIGNAAYKVSESHQFVRG